MSLAVLLEAARDTIRTAYTLDETGCDVCPDGQPHPVCGEKFYAVHPGDSQNSSDLRLDETFDFTVTVTVRTGVAPQDRIGSDRALTTAGVLAKARAVAILLNMNYTLMNAANTALGVLVNGFHKPPVYKSMRYLGPKDATWFWAEPGDDAHSGIAVAVQFGDARRVQYIESAS